MELLGLKVHVYSILIEISKQFLSKLHFYQDCVSIPIGPCFLHVVSILLSKILAQMILLSNTTEKYNPTNPTI